MRLTPGRYARVFGVLQRLYACLDSGEVRRLIPALVDEVIESDGAAWFEFDTRDWSVTEVEESRPVVVPRTRLLIPRALATHPFTPIWSSLGPRALKMSDVPRAERRRYLDENREAYRDIGSEQAVLPLRLSPRGVTNVSLRRMRGTFTEEDLAVLDLLRPHFLQAMENAKRYRCAAAVSAAPDPRWSVLTPREREVAEWMAEGKTNAEIGCILQISFRTVDRHVEAILRKLGVENRTAAALQIVAAGRMSGGLRR